MFLHILLIVVNKMMENIVKRHLLRKFAQKDDFIRDQISFKEKFRITEQVDMERASKEIINNFILRNSKKPSNYKFVFEDAEPLLFDDDYTWFAAEAVGFIQSFDENYPVKINLTDGEIWTVTLYERF